MELSPSTSGLRWAKRIIGPLVAVDRVDCVLLIMMMGMLLFVVVVMVM